MIINYDNTGKPIPVVVMQVDGTARMYGAAQVRRWLARNKVAYVTDQEIRAAAGATTLSAEKRAAILREFPMLKR